MAKSLLKQKWVAVDGSIYSAETQEFRSDFPGNRKTYQIHPSIAFNVGKELAEHIVHLHNSRLQENQNETTRS